MIKFIPVKKQLQSPITLADSADLISNKSAEALASQLNGKFGDKSCPKHPNLNSTITVTVNTDPTQILFNIQDYCCEDFKKILSTMTEKHT
ncbi:hypothetical protein HGH93_04445 [Chitinophaga polysaccharea]|uniref:hypothetical protein n=1 Tax=Chitinophaga polysaccharea TaxID=1293035 RepID=UPI0014551CC7|nr:hypothetical protein [Chitinophaga polysaccharea]NLR57334.1 hypothetical protein [Chitinophaga polysaccharea]